MRVLVACEYSGTVRDAFLARGHDAISCDLQPTATPGPHIQGDALDALELGGWDLVIAHPPCTYLANSGLRWLERPERWPLMVKAAVFFLAFLEAPEVPRVAVENPVPHEYARELIGPPSQYVQPHEYGVLETKRTGLWLRGLPPLLADEDGKAATWARPPDQQKPGWHLRANDAMRRELRNRTSPGIAAAMARQWGI